MEESFVSKSRSRMGWTFGHSDQEQDGVVGRNQKRFGVQRRSPCGMNEVWLGHVREEIAPSESSAVLLLY